MKSMLSLRTNLHPARRPQAVAVIALLFGLLAAASVPFALLLFIGRTALSKGGFLIGGGLEHLGPMAFLFNAAISTLMNMTSAIRSSAAGSGKPPDARLLSSIAV
jgi:hypothetical protein